MKQIIQLQIPNPCHEKWEAMNPTEQGRFCLSCRKEVIDFSVMTDREILKYISNASKETCGRFGKEQLDREIIEAPAPRKIWWRYWMGAAASLIMLSSKSNAQIKIKGEPVICTPSNKPNLLVVGKIQAPQLLGEDKQNDNYTVKGFVKDERGTPIVGASIIVKNTRQRTLSNETGAFSIKMKGSNYHTLSISCIGYQMQEIKIPASTENNQVLNVNLQLHEMVMGMGEVVVVKKKKRTLLNFFKPDSVKCVKYSVEPGLNVYPNPVTIGSDIKIRIPDHLNGIFSLSVIDVSGNIIVKKEINVVSKGAEEILNCDRHFKSGLYVLTLTGQGKTFNSKIIVQ